MTQTERVTRLATLHTEVENLVSEYNEAVLTRETTADALSKINDETEKKVNEYTSIARDMAFTECQNAENPMLYAVNKLTYPTIAVKDVQDKDGGKITRSLIEKDKAIDLMRLHKFCDKTGGIGANPKWIPMLEKFNLLMTLRAAKELGIDPKDINDSYAMSDMAKEIDMGKTPTSNTSMLKALQTLITAMLGEGYNALSHDVNYLVMVYTKKGRKALSVNCANHRYFCAYIANICHRIVTDGRYDIEYKAKKN